LIRGSGHEDLSFQSKHGAGQIKRDKIQQTLPTLVNIAGGPKGDGLKKQIEAGQYPASSGRIVCSRFIQARRTMANALTLLRAPNARRGRKLVNGRSDKGR
jgi:hypothetical protein